MENDLDFTRPELGCLIRHAFEGKNSAQALSRQAPARTIQFEIPDLEPAPIQKNFQKRNLNRINAAKSAARREMRASADHRQLHLVFAECEVAAE
ncbi:hypothetical protein [Massilia sp. LC238]|uniref:hypothetical protein n=1 Tax=Massilia sp. LC238 TaxID=1502852 RepID=UPI001377C8E9|nr:hypothetical protein [Massilia sp. LC238]